MDLAIFCHTNGTPIMSVAPAASESVGAWDDHLERISPRATDELRVESVPSSPMLKDELEELGEEGPVYSTRGCAAVLHETVSNLTVSLSVQSSLRWMTGTRRTIQPITHCRHEVAMLQQLCRVRISLY